MTGVVINNSAFGATSLGIDAPLVRCGADEHHPRGRPRLPHRRPERPCRCGAARRLIMQDRVRVFRHVRWGSLDLNLIQANLQLLTHQHG